MGHRFISCGAWALRAVLVFAVLSLGLPSSTPAARRQPGTAPHCRPTSPIVSIPELREASGVAVNRRVPGRLCAYNDSDPTVLVALDTKESVTGRVRPSPAAVENWEAVAIEPCAAGSCLYVADIRDGDAERRQVTIYRVAEPVSARDSAPVSEVFHATYADGPHDADTLLITPDDGLFLVRKRDASPVAMYRFHHELPSGASVPPDRAGKPCGSGKPANDDRITGGAVSPDGEWVMLRTRRTLTFHRSAELIGLGPSPEAQEHARRRSHDCAVSVPSGIAPR